MSRARALAAPGLMVLLAACASSPHTNFYTLEPVQAQHAQPAASRAVRIAAVHVPAVLDRQQIVREDSSGRVALSDQNRWAAPLGDMVRRVLTQDLLRRMPAEAVILPDQPAPAQTSSVAVDILRLQSDAAGEITLEGTWSLVPPGSDTASFTRQFHFTEQANAQGYPAQVQAMSRAVGRLADDLAVGLRRGPP